MDMSYRLGAFLGMFFIIALWEFLSPRRDEDQQRSRRWPVNLGLVTLNSILVRFTVGGLIYQSALLAQQNHIGLLNWAGSGSGWNLVMTLIMLDLTIYGQHVASHKIPLLWKLHQVHHTDPVYDTTTGVRFHPLEIFFSLGVKVVAVFLIGADPFAVILFEVILNTSAVFNHGNIALPLHVDRYLRKIVVTPDMHRVHHSVYREETDSNYGFALSVWDRLFGTYRDQPRDGHEKMRIGLPYARGKEAITLSGVITMPLHYPPK